jgi:hypothetical protein
MTRGILYFGAGIKHIQEAKRAAEHTAHVWPGIKITGYTTDTSNAIMRERIRAMMRTPYHRTLYLDTDTWLLEPVPELFDVLLNFDIALAHAPLREAYPVDAPASFPEYNAGVIAYKKSTPVLNFLLDWEKRFARDYESRRDEQIVGWYPSQPSLREALYHSGLRIATLPPEYNWRGLGYACGPVKILHCRRSFELVEAEINASHKPRVCAGWEVRVDGEA